MKPAGCYRCGSSAHKAPECKFEGTCDYCKKNGHKQSVCKKKASDDARAHMAAVSDNEVVVRTARVFDVEDARPLTLWEQTLPDPPRSPPSGWIPSVPVEQFSYNAHNDFSFENDVQLRLNTARYTNFLFSRVANDPVGSSLSLFYQPADYFWENLAGNSPPNDYFPMVAESMASTCYGAVMVPAMEPMVTFGAQTLQNNLEDDSLLLSRRFPIGFGENLGPNLPLNDSVPAVSADRNATVYGAVMVPIGESMVPLGSQLLPSDLKEVSQSFQAEIPPTEFFPAPFEMKSEEQSYVHVGAWSEENGYTSEWRTNNYSRQLFGRSFGREQQTYQLWK